jgi:hypothetical protein
MAMNLPPVLRQRYLDSNGNPLASGKLYTYQAGTTTPQATYTDSTGGTPNANPIVLDADGEAAMWLNPDYSYKFVLKDSSDVTQWTVDNVVGLLSTGSVVTASIADEAVTTAKIDDLAVTTGKLDDLAVTTGKIANAGVTALKMASSGLGPSALLNAVVTASVGSNALTLALKTEAGTDATSTDVIKIAFRSATLADGDYEVVSVTGALSTVVSSGSTLGHVSGAEWPIYVYALNNAGTVELAYSTIPVDERYLQTTTAEGGAGAADAATTFYSTTARTSKAVRLLAVLKSTQTVGGTWAAVPTAISAATQANTLAVVPGRVTGVAVPAGGVGISASCGTATNGTGSEADVANLFATIVTTGRPVFVGLQPTGGATTGRISISATGQGTFKFYRSATEIFQTVISNFDGSYASNYPPGELWFIDTPSAGTYTYKMTSLNTFANLSVIECKLVVYEL